MESHFELLVAPPQGFSYRTNFLTIAEEKDLLKEITKLPLAPFQMHGVTSRRLVLHFGWDYHYDAWKIKPAPPLPNFLRELRAKAAGLWQQDPDLFEEA